MANCPFCVNLGKFLMETLRWWIERLQNGAAKLPKCIVTRRPFDAGGALDSLTALLLPSAGAMSPALDQPIETTEEDCIGLWMGTGFPILPSVSSYVSKSTWIANFPSCAIYDEAFTQSLSEVNIGPERERRHLKAFKDSGYKVVLNLTTDQHVNAVFDVDPDALIIVLRSAADIESLRAGYVDALRAAVGNDTPIILHGGTGQHLPNSPASMGIEALLHAPSSV